MAHKQTQTDETHKHMHRKKNTQSREIHSFAAMVFRAVDCVITSLVESRQTTIELR